MKRIFAAVLIALTLSAVPVFARPYENYTCDPLTNCSLGYNLWMIWTCQSGHWLGCFY